MIKTNKFSTYIKEDYLYILKDEARTISTKQEIEQMSFQDALNGNTVGYIYSPNLNSSDNTWIQDYEIVKLFDRDHSECQFGIYTIKGNIGDLELKNLEKDFNNVKKSQNKHYLNELHIKHIIKIGSCSC